MMVTPRWRVRKGTIRLALGLAALAGMLLLGVLVHAHADGHEDHCALCLAAASAFLPAPSVILTSPGLVTALAASPAPAAQPALVVLIGARAPPVAL